MNINFLTLFKYNHKVEWHLPFFYNIFVFSFVCLFLFWHFFIFFLLPQLFCNEHVFVFALHATLLQGIGCNVDTHNWHGVVCVHKRMYVCYFRNEGCMYTSWCIYLYAWKLVLVTCSCYMVLDLSLSLCLCVCVFLFVF